MTLCYVLCYNLLIMPTSYVPEILNPISDGRPEIPVDEITNTLTYQALRGLVHFRRQDMASDNDEKALWMPNSEQLSLIRQQIEPRLPFLIARKRLVNYADDEDNLSQLMPHQADIFSTVTRTVAASHEAADSHTCIIAATGTGKSYLMGTFVEAAHKVEDADKKAPLKTLILTPTNILVNQIKEDLKSRVEGVDIGVFNMYEKQLDKPVTVMTYSSFVKQTKQKALEKDMFDQVLLDEVDLALAPDTRAEVQDFISDKMAFGFTATGVNSEFRDVNHVFPNVIDDYDVKQSIEQGILSPVQVWLVQTGEQLDIGKIKRFEDIPAEKLHELGKRTQRGLLSTKIATDFVSAGKKGLIHCPAGDSCSFAKERAEQLNNILIKDPSGKSRRIKAAAVGSSIPESKDLIKAYKAGEYDVLCYVKMIGRGFDDPDTKFLIDESPTLSPVEGTQGPGRTLRFKIDKIAQIVHLVDDITSDGKPINAFTMLHALGAEQYEPGMYFGPQDNWRGSDDRYPAKAYEHLELFSHEIQAIIKRTGIDLRRMFELGANGELNTTNQLVTKKYLQSVTGLGYALISSFFEKSGVKPINMGRVGNYDERFTEVLKEFSQIHRKNVNPTELGWVDAQLLEPTLLEKLKSTQLFNPVKHIQGKRDQKNLHYEDESKSYFSPTQWKIIQETVLKDAVIHQIGDEKLESTVFNIEGDPMEVIIRDLEKDIYHMAHKSGLKEVFRSLSPRLIFSYNIGTEEYKASQHLVTKRREDLEKFEYELPLKVRNLLYNSPLFRSIKQGQEELQQLFEEAQTISGTKGRIVGRPYYSSINYGYYTTETETSAISSHIFDRSFVRIIDDRDYGKSYISLDSLSSDIDVDVRTALSLMSSIFSYGHSWNYPETPPEDVQQVCLDIWQGIANMESRSTLLKNDNTYRGNNVFSFQQTINLKSLMTSILDASSAHGIDMIEVLDNQLKNLQIFTNNPLVARNKYSLGGNNQMLKY